jgi:N-acetylglucosaminylphosphatidylinositol deacetylase
MIQFLLILLISYLLVNIVTYYLLIKIIKLNQLNRLRLKKIRNYCIIIAHPDDEVLFFGPTILNLLKTGSKLHVLCLSNGNYYGLGLQREVELRNSCKKLSINSNKSKDIEVTIETKFQDGPVIDWELDEVENTITSYLIQHKIDCIVTFDQYGVSYHVNHCSLSKAVARIRQKNENLTVYTLKTCFVLRKYLFIFDLMLTLLVDLELKGKNRKKLVFLNTPSDYLCNIKAMFEHKTQLLWFRYFYIISSRYMFINFLDLVE